MVNILEHISVVIQLTPSKSLSPVTALHAVICQWCVLMESSSSAYRDRFEVSIIATHL